MFTKRNIHPSLKGNRSHVKIMKRHGVTLTFRHEPHPNAVDSILYVTTEIKNVGIMTLSIGQKDWPFSKGMPKIDYGRKADAAIGAACALAELRDGNEFDETAALVVKVTPGATHDRIRNELLLVTAMQAGIILQPQTGYSTQGMASAAGIDMRKRESQQPGIPFPPPAESAKVEPPAKIEPPVEADKKKTLH